MNQDYLNKLKSLPPAIRAKLDSDEILDQLDALDSEFGIKSTSLIISILLGEIKLDKLANTLITDYGFNEFLAHKVAASVRDVATDLGYGLTTEIAPVTAVNKSRMVISNQERIKLANNNILNKPATSTVMTFSREDDEEVSRYLPASGQAPKIADYTDAAADIISAFGYPASDELMVRRLGSIVLARLKDVRDELETKENLMKSHKVGGMEFSAADADRLLKIIKSALAGQAVSSDLKTSSKEVEKILEEYEDDEEADLPTIKDNQTGSKNNNLMTIEMEDGLPVIRMPDDLMVIPNSSPTPSALRASPPRAEGELMSNQLNEDQTLLKKARQQLPVTPQDVKIKTVKDLPLPQPRPFAANEISTGNMAVPRPTNRPNLDDVKFTKKLMGPIEELESMTLIDFRRLSTDPVAVTEKIKEKIDLLEKEHFGKRLEGITAWQKNEVSKFYRLLGQTAMAEDKSIEAVIQERLSGNKPTLSLDEFHAVMNLNQQLRY